MPGILLARTVARQSSTCAHCGFLILPYDARYDLRVGGVNLNVCSCSLRCAEREAHERGRGPLLLHYAEAA